MYDVCGGRQQSQHLGITKKRRDSRDVAVSLHNYTASTSGLELVYSVRVSGKLVPAVTAAGDMRLLTDKEVVAELGYPLVTKAERNYLSHISHLLFLIIHRYPIKL